MKKPLMKMCTCTAGESTEGPGLIYKCPEVDYFINLV